jgi:hypothetical protein
MHAAQLWQQLAAYDQEVSKHSQQQFARCALEPCMVAAARRLELSGSAWGFGVWSGPGAKLGHGVCGPFRVAKLQENGVVLLSTGSTVSLQCCCLRQAHQQLESSPGQELCACCGAGLLSLWAAGYIVCSAHSGGNKYSADNVCGTVLSMCYALLQQTITP